MYEINVTNINNVFTANTGKNLKLYFQNELGEIETVSCFFIKYDGYPLFISCIVILEGTSWLKEITEEIICNNADIRYNFRIQPVKNFEKINLKNEENFFAHYTYPKTLNFIEADKLTVDFWVSYSELFKGITFNPDKEDLSCENINRIVRSTVPKSHFEGKKKWILFHKI